MGLSKLLVHLTDRRDQQQHTRDLGDWQRAMTRGVVIGSDPSCDVLLEGPGVEPRHACFYARGHHQYLDYLEAVGDSGRIDGAPFEVGPWTVQFSSAPKELSSSLALEVIASELRGAIAGDVEGEDMVPWTILADALDATPSAKGPQEILAALQGWMRALALMLKPWPKYAAVVEQVRVGSETSGAPWSRFGFSLRRVFAITTVIGRETSTDLMIQLFGEVLGAVYAAPGCALVVADGASWALALRNGHDILWLRGTREEMLASVPDAHFPHAMACASAAPSS